MSRTSLAGRTADGGRGRHGEAYSLPLPSPGPTGAGAAVSAGDLRDKWAQIGGTFEATVAVDVSIDGTTWEEVVVVAGPALIELLPTVIWVRVRVVSHTSGTPTAALAGYLVWGTHLY